MDIVGDLQRYLVLSEIMYHPPDVGLVSGEEFEFIELRNTGPGTLDLSGLTFTSGLNFTFTNGTLLAPGQCFVLGRNPGALQTEYPALVVNGVYTGKLGNGGDTITLTHPYGTNLLSVTYSDAAPWPVTADGFGFSLVWDSASPTHYRASSEVGGSPGGEDAPMNLPPVLVSEVLSCAVPPGLDAIELYNPTAADADIGGWFITDDAAYPWKYHIPAGTLLPAGCYVVFDENQFNATPGLGASFSFSSGGEVACLFSGNAAGELTGYSHGFNFGAAEEGMSFGRHVTSEGREHFVAQTATTLGTNNPSPRVGPLVINELMYHPPDAGTNDNTLDEFIEVLNITGSPVDLFDSLASTNTWQLKGGVDFVFPTNLALPAGQFLLLVNFSPTNAAQSNAFCARYAVPAGVSLLGPYGGKLNNGSDDVELKKPVLLHGTNAAWVLVDEVEYSRQAPWPCGTDGTGASLQRQVPINFGNDPANWAAAAPTAGRANTFVPSGAPVVACPPADTVGMPGGSASFSVGVCGPPPYTYQWRFREDAIEGATNPVCVVSPVLPSSEGSYCVVIRNPFGSVTSAPAILYPPQAPAIARQPVSQAVPRDADVVFTVGAAGPPPLTYQWLCYGTNLPGQTGPMLTLANVQPRQQGPYSVVVANPYGNTESSDAYLTVHVPCVILAHPTNVVLAPNPATNTATTSNATFWVFAAGMGPLAYQWRFWGTNLPGATDATLIISNVALVNAGPYSVRVSDSITTLTSSNATLALLTKPTITVPIQPQSVVSEARPPFRSGPCRSTRPCP